MKVVLLLLMTVTDVALSGIVRNDRNSCFIGIK